MSAAGPLRSPRAFRQAWQLAAHEKCELVQDNRPRSCLERFSMVCLKSSFYTGQVSLLTSWLSWPKRSLRTWRVWWALGTHRFFPETHHSRAEVIKKVQRSVFQSNGTVQFSLRCRAVFYIGTWLIILCVCVCVCACACVHICVCVHAGVYIYVCVCVCVRGCVCAHVLFWWCGWVYTSKLTLADYVSVVICLCLHAYRFQDTFLVVKLGD